MAVCCLSRGRRPSSTATPTHRCGGAAWKAEAVRAKVAAGEYATQSDVIRDGLRVPLARDRAVEEWLRKNLAATCDKLKADPSRAVAVGAVRARLAPAHARENRKAPPNA